MKIAPDMIVVSVVGLVCLVAMPGCELSYNGRNSDGSSVQPTSDPTASSSGTDSTSTSTNQINSAAEPGFGGNVIAGNTADSGAEIFRSNWNGHDVRCLGADDTGNGYFMSDVIDQTGALELGSDGTATGHNFISPRTGLHYRFEGFREGTSTSSRFTENPHPVTPGSGTLRCYWNPVEGL